MRSSSPGSWDDLLWRLRAEAAAAQAGDFAAVGALAAGATPPGPPPTAAVAQQALHLQLRLEGLLVRRAQDTARHVELLRAVAAGGAPSRRLDLRR
jgi:hypothetical protein